MDRHHYEIFTKFGDDGFLLHLDNARGYVLIWDVKTSYAGLCNVQLNDKYVQLRLDDAHPRWHTLPQLQIYSWSQSCRIC